MASPQIVGSKTATQERWFKLYRKIHNIFIKDELVHVDDFKAEIKNLHKRIDQLNQKLDTNMTNLAAILNSHIHTAPLGPTSPPTSGVFSPDSMPIPTVPFTDPNMQAYEKALQSLGPGMAPISTTASTDDAAAALQARSDIGA
jgi:hypothetical protein